MSSDASDNAMMTTIIGSAARSTARTIRGSGLVMPLMPSTRKPTTAPSQPTEVLTCRVSTSLRAGGDIAINDRPAGAGRRRAAP